MATKKEPLSRAEIIYAANRSDVGSLTYFGHPTCKGIYDEKLVNAMYPIDERTGLPMTDVGRLTSPHLTDAEKERIMSHLKPEKGTFLPSSLSDEEVLQMIPPRYFQDAVDVQIWRDYLAKDVMPNLDVPQEDNPNVEPSNNNEE